MAVYEIKPTENPPASQTGVLLWLKENLFSSPFNIALTFIALYIIYLILPPILDWTIFSANFSNASNSECGRDGACWSFIYANLKLFIYGFYPESELWRIDLGFYLIIVFVAISTLFKKSRYKFHYIASSFIIYPIIAFILLKGGIFGLDEVPTEKWGGLTLTIVVAAVGIVASFPIGVLFALGRQSKMRVIRFISVVYIEFIRGVPLITILFMASVVLPLFFSSSMDIDKLLRALIGITMFQTAYIAEVIRGGLQAIPQGQYEAADSVGLSYAQKIGFIILPQALKISIPNIVGSFIALFKDTTLVLIIGLFDMLATVGLATQNTSWLGREAEGYVFVALVIWVILYAMSRYSIRLERRFNTENG
jgi:general L-amino acid transport system permease protein